MMCIVVSSNVPRCNISVKGEVIRDLILIRLNLIVLYLLTCFDCISYHKHIHIITFIDYGLWCLTLRMVLIQLETGMIFDITLVFMVGRVMVVFNATFNNISVISWQSV